MIRILLATFSVCFITLYCTGQGSLEFNQIKQVVNVQETVPAGKVWKVEGVMYNRGIPAPFCTGSTSCGNTNQVDQITVDGQNIVVREFESRGDYDQVNTVIWESKFPLWLGAGSTLQASTGVYAINVIEFNILP
jgi:hypothetical protein